MLSKKRLKIIKIINNFMDKTPTNGCLLKSIYCSDTYYSIFTTKSWKYGWNLNYHIFDTLTWDIISDSINTGYFVLWHYNDSAVENYIKSLPLWTNIYIWENQNKIIEIFSEKNWKETFTIPNKWIELYNKSEDDNLFEILKYLTALSNNKNNI